MADAPIPDFLNSNPVLGRFFLSREEKADKEKGKAIIKAIYNQQTNNDSSLNFFKARNARWIMLLLWSKGSQNIKEFLDYINVSDANKAWVNIDMTQSRIAPQFVQTLVESMAKSRTYPCVKAIDDGSLTEKEDRMYEAIFRMKEVETINDVQTQAGIQIEPSNVYIPDDEMSAKVYFELEDRLPKEIRFEKMLFKVQDDIHFERILNRKTIFDLTVLNCAVTKIEKVGYKKYTVRRCVPTNMVYNFFMNDNGECEITQIGEFYSLKVKDFRSRFGKSAERPEGLSEKQIFDLAKLSTNKSIGTYSNVGMFNYIWNDVWANSGYSYSRPYDDSSILVFDCEVNFDEEQYYVSKKDAFGKDDIQAKSNVPYRQVKKDGTIIEQPRPEGTEIIKQNKNTWMRGVYAPYGDVMLYWGKPDIIITPYTDVAKPLSAFSINIPNNDGEYVPSLFERIMEPLREYQLVKLKRKQIIALVEPDGFRIDIESARNVDLGTGDSIAWEEIVRIKNQTGVELWSSKGIDPLAPQSPPITQGTQSTNISKIVELTNVLSAIVSEIRQLIGVPQYRDGSDVGERTSGVLQEQQNISSFNVTNFVDNSNKQLWEETFYKLNLLHWNDIVKEEPESKDDIINTRFSVSVKMKSTDFEIQQLEKDIDRYSQMPDAMGNPSLTLKDAMMLREIDDAKLARWYLTKTYEQNRRMAMEEKDRLTAATADAQNKSLQQNAENEQKIQAEKLSAEKDMVEFKATKEKEVALLNGLMQAIGKGVIDPSVIMPAIQQLVPNIRIPLSQENKQITASIMQEEQQEMQEQPMQQ